jgi:hypothetical protein
MTRDKKHALLEFDFQDVESGDWVEGEGLLDDLLGLREELIGGACKALTKSLKR